MALSNMWQTSVKGHRSSVQKRPKFQKFSTRIFHKKSKCNDGQASFIACIINLIQQIF